jgi:hypothetical protein
MVDPKPDTMSAMVFGWLSSSGGLPKSDEECSGYELKKVNWRHCTRARGKTGD